MNAGVTFITIVSLFILSSCVAGQDGKTKMKNAAPDFSGTWLLDTSRSKLDNVQKIESMTLTVTQTRTDIRVISFVKLVPPDPAFLGGLATRPLEQNTTNVYRLDGKETPGEMMMPTGPQAATVKATLEGAKLFLSQTLPGDTNLTLRKTWTLSADGKTLTVEQVQEPSGAAATFVFSKKV